MSKTCSYKSLENPLNTQESLPFRTIDFFLLLIWCCKATFILLQGLLLFMKVSRGYTSFSLSCHFIIDVISRMLFPFEFLCVKTWSCFGDPSTIKLLRFCPLLPVGWVLPHRFGSSKLPLFFSSCSVWTRINEAYWEHKLIASFYIYFILCFHVWVFFF